MISPAPGSQLTGKGDTFKWTQAQGDSGGIGGWLDISIVKPEADDVYSKEFEATLVSVTVDDLPTDKPVYVTLVSYNMVDDVFTKTYTYNVAEKPADEQFAIKVNASGRVAEIVSPEWFVATRTTMDSAAAQAICSELYKNFSDQFDFIYIVSNQSASSGKAAEYHAVAMNGGATTFGSAGKLQGVVHVKKADGLLSSPSLHELQKLAGVAEVDLKSANVLYLVLTDQSLSEAELKQHDDAVVKFASKHAGIVVGQLEAARTTK